MKKTLTIAYRVYPGIGKKPVLFAYDKRKAITLNLKSINRCLENFDVHFIAILDSCPSDYKNIIEDSIKVAKLEFIEVKKAGNANTFILQIDKLLEQEHSEIVMFIEDDYFFLDGGVEQIYDVINTGNCDFISPYDHLDYYHHDFHKYKMNYKKINDHIYKTVNSTCLTFMTNKNVLSQVRDIFLTYRRKNFDSSMWLAITKIGNTRYGKILEIFTGKRYMAMIYIKMLLFTPIKHLLGKKFRLLAPEPGLALHMEADHISPNVDWQAEFKRLM